MCDETPCPAREDKIHCNCWYDGEACCACGDPEMSMCLKIEYGMVRRANAAESIYALADDQEIPTGHAR